MLRSARDRIGGSRFSKKHTWNQLLWVIEHLSRSSTAKLSSREFARRVSDREVLAAGVVSLTAKPRSELTADWQTPASYLGGRVMQGQTQEELLRWHQSGAGLSRQASRAGGCRLCGRRFRLTLTVSARAVVVVILTAAPTVPTEGSHA